LLKQKRSWINRFQYRLAAFCLLHLVPPGQYAVAATLASRLHERSADRDLAYILRHWDEISPDQQESLVALLQKLAASSTSKRGFDWQVRARRQPEIRLMLSDVAELQS